MDALRMIRITMKEFDSVPDEEVALFLEISKPLLSKKRFGNLYEQGLAYLSAHKMKLSGLGSAIGAGTIGDTIGLSSVSEGGISVSFTNNQTANTSIDAEYGLTIYGMQFLQLRKSCIMTIVSAGG